MVKTKMIDATILKPLPTPDGTSLEEQLNTFLATKKDKDVLDVLVDFESTGKYGMTTTYTATVVYRE